MAAWPPSPSAINSTGLGYDGVLPISLAWGTEGLYTSVIVVSLRASQMIEEIKIDNGSGITATQVLLNDGRQIEVTVIDDRSISWPTAGAVVTLFDPFPNGAGATSLNLEVVDASYNAARKAPGERTLLTKRYLLISPQQM